MRLRTIVCAGVEQHKAAGAVGVFRLAGVKTGLADGGRLLITQRAADGNLALKGAACQRHPIKVGITAWSNLRQQLAGDAENRQQFIVPGERLQIHQHRAAGIGGVGDVLAAGQVPDQPGVNRAKEQIARFGLGAHTGHVIQQPTDFGTGKVGGNGQPGLVID